MECGRGFSYPRLRWAYGMIMGQEDPTHYYQRAMKTPTAFSLAIVFIVGFYFVLILIERHRKWSV